MKIIKIIVLKNDIFSSIANTTRYTGEKSDTANPAEVTQRVATVESDTELLSGYWQDACAHLADTLRSFITETTFGKDTFSVTLCVSGAYDESLTPAVETGIFNIIVAMIIYRWFRIVMPERAAEWNNEARHQFNALLGNLYHRRKPQRKI